MKQAINGNRVCECRLQVECYFRECDLSVQLPYRYKTFYTLVPVNWSLKNATRHTLIDFPKRTYRVGFWRIYFRGYSAKCLFTLVARQRQRRMLVLSVAWDKRLKTFWGHIIVQLFLWTNRLWQQNQTNLRPPSLQIILLWKCWINFS